MGRLRKYARPTERKTKSRVLPVRLPEDIYQEFHKYCKELGLSLSEAVFLLIQEELRDEYKSTTERIHTDHEPKPERIRPTITRPRRSGSGSRFTTKDFVVNGRLPCPICGTWPEKQKNISRHMREVHNSTTEEVYKAHMETIKRMVAEARGEKAEGPGA